MFNIERQTLINNFISLIKKGHLLIVGYPGTGKTWLIAKVAEKYQRKIFPI